MLESSLLTCRCRFIGWICSFLEIFCFCFSSWRLRGLWSVWATCPPPPHSCPWGGGGRGAWWAAAPPGASPCWWTSSAKAAAPGGPASSGSRWESWRRGSATQKPCPGTRPGARAGWAPGECCRRRRAARPHTWAGTQGRLCPPRHTRPAQISSTAIRTEDEDFLRKNLYHPIFKTLKIFVSIQYKHWLCLLLSFSSPLWHCPRSLCPARWAAPCRSCIWVPRPAGGPPPGWGSCSPGAAAGQRNYNSRSAGTRHSPGKNHGYSEGEISKIRIFVIYPNLRQLSWISLLPSRDGEKVTGGHFGHPKEDRWCNIVLMHSSVHKQKLHAITAHLGLQEASRDSRKVQVINFQGTPHLHYNFPYSWRIFDNKLI